MPDKLQVTENGQNLGVDISIQNIHYVSVKPKPKQIKKLTKVAFVPNDSENAVIRAGMQKFGLPKATDIIRMALRKLAESEGLELKAS